MDRDGYTRRIQKHMVDELHTLFQTDNLSSIDSSVVDRILSDLNAMNSRLSSANSQVRSFGTMFPFVLSNPIDSIGQAIAAAANLGLMREDVIVPLPQNVIDSMSETLFDSTRRAMEPDTCSICSTQFATGDVVLTTKCNHDFHKVCILRWFSRSVFCPNCRADQRDSS